MYWNMTLQLPKLLKAFFAERQRIKTLVKQHQFDAIISDSRFGCFHSKVKSVFISHQLHIKIPNSFISKVVEWINTKIIGQFSECWVPDLPNHKNLAGHLSHPPIHPNTKYLGLLSRMKQMEVESHYTLIAVLSGPEPQRSRLERILIPQLRELPYKSLLVQGKTELLKKEQLKKNLEVVSYLNTRALNHAIASSKYVLCRSGYSSLMDLAILNKKALLIPTPGQTEQEYLANRLFQKGLFLKQKQAELNVKSALERLDQFSGLNLKDQDTHRLTNIIRSFQERLSINK